MIASPSVSKRSLNLQARLFDLETCRVDRDAWPLVSVQWVVLFLWVVYVVYVRVIS